MLCENPRTKRIQHYQNINTDAGIVRYQRGPDYQISQHESHIVVYEKYRYFLSNHTAAYALLFHFFRKTAETIYGETEICL